MKTAQRFSRRTFLRGAGVSLALPLLEVMTPLRARAATAIATTPPTTTRTAARVARAPPRRAPAIPSTSSRTSASTALVTMRVIADAPEPSAAMRAIAGIDPIANDAADTKDACTGRAIVCSTMPSSSRRWEPSASDAVSWVATCSANSRVSPRDS